MFKGCSSLLSLPDISKWNTNNLTNLSHMFKGCSSLPSVFDFSKIYKTKSLSSLYDGIYKIFIKTITSKTIFIFCLNNGTIQNIKDEIKFKEGIPPELKLFILNGKKLEDCSKTLKDYNIQNMSTLHLALKKK